MVSVQDQVWMLIGVVVKMLDRKKQKGVIDLPLSSQLADPTILAKKS